MADAPDWIEGLAPDRSNTAVWTMWPRELRQMIDELIAYMKVEGHYYKAKDVATRLEAAARDLGLTCTDGHPIRVTPPNLVTYIRVHHKVNAWKDLKPRGES